MRHLTLSNVPSYLVAGPQLHVVSILALAGLCNACEGSCPEHFYQDGQLCRPVPDAGPHTSVAGQSSNPQEMAGSASQVPSTTAGVGMTVTAGTSAEGTAGTSNPGAAVAGNGTIGSGGSSASGNAGTSNSGSAGLGVVGGTRGATAGDGSAGTPTFPASGGGTGGAGSGAAGTTQSASSVKPPCLKKDSQLVVLGDSYVTWSSHQFQQNLASATGIMFRTYAVGGVSMASGGIEPSNNIPQQFEKALQEDKDIVTVIMDGGNNDILLADNAMFSGGDACKNNAMCGSVEVCKKIMDSATSAATGLMRTKMAGASVKDVIYFFYPDIPAGTPLGGSNPAACLSYARQGTKGACEGTEGATGGKLRCHWVDLAPVFAGHKDWFAAGDIHPNSQGAMAMAQAISQLMKDKCLAQSPSSGCCTP